MDRRSARGRDAEREQVAEWDRRAGRSLLSEVSFQSTDRCCWVCAACILESNSQPRLPLAMEWRVVEAGIAVLPHLWSR